MSPRICGVCEDTILKGDPQITISGQPIHKYCDLSVDGGPCQNEDCAYRWCVHGGPCQD